MRLRHGARYG